MEVQVNNKIINYFKNIKKYNYDINDFLQQFYNIFKDCILIHKYHESFMIPNYKEHCFRKQIYLYKCTIEDKSIYIIFTYDVYLELEDYQVSTNWNNLYETFDLFLNECIIAFDENDFNYTKYLNGDYSSRIKDINSILQFFKSYFTDKNKRIKAYLKYVTNLYK